MCKKDDILMRIFQIFKPYNGRLMRFWFGGSLLIGLCDPDHVQKILSSPKLVIKHEIYDFMKVFLGQGLITGSGPLHKQHRRLIQPLFDIKFIQDSEKLFRKHVTVCIGKLEKFMDKGKFDITPLIHECIIDYFSEIILGLPFRCQLKGMSDFDQAMIEVFDLIFARMTQLHLQFGILFNLSSYKSVQDRLKRIIRGQGQKALEESRKRRSQLTKDPTIEEKFSPLIDRITNVLGEINDEQIIDHILTLYAAAEDTISNIAVFFVVCLGIYPEYQDKAVKEIEETIGKSKIPTLEDVPKLKYIDSCLKEVLRLFPIAPLIIRKCSEDYKLENYVIPEGAAIVVPVFNIHRDPAHWERPHDFYPDHFIPEKVVKRHIYSYLPFSAGPRGCIGKLISHNALKIFICIFLQHFKVEVDGKLSDLDLKMDISVRPKNSYNIMLKRRNWH
ncbi:hypothetical protein ABEB36_006355 [Hypothenemus hampei]|uniref:Cytochrome P450 n=1 Tax=Hypothenemus hampei TaxID=57062 RepID=A0ABD1EQA6_HYPHA